MEKHTETTQPADTTGKTVVYKNRDVYNEDGEIIAEGRLHMPYPADLLNWAAAEKGVKIPISKNQQKQLEC